MIEWFKKVFASSDLRDTPQVTRAVLIGTCVVAVVCMAMLGVIYAMGGHRAASQMYIGLLALAYLVIIWVCFKRRLYRISAWLLICLYVVLGVALLLIWGLRAPIGMLSFGFVVLLAGTMLGARYILPVTGCLIILIVALQLLTTDHILHPDTTRLGHLSTFGDVVSYVIIFIIFAFVASLSGRQMEQALGRALTAETALQKEKRLLAVRLARKTRQLRDVQAEEMRQLYRVAELGQMSTAALHDLANYLTMLSFDMDDLERHYESSRVLVRAKESLRYLEILMEQVRDQVKQTATSKRFNVMSAVDMVVKSLEERAAHSKVTIEVASAPDRARLYVSGDPLRMMQVLTILTTNAIEAYDGHAGRDRRVVVTVDIKEKELRVTICDFGAGITPLQRKTLFHKPHTNKKHGMGIGLFIAHSMIETHFGGSLTLDPRTDHTQFEILVPKAAGRTLQGELPDAKYRNGRAERKK